MTRHNCIITGIKNGLCEKKGKTFKSSLYGATWIILSKAFKIFLCEYVPFLHATNSISKNIYCVHLNHLKTEITIEK